MKTIDNKRVTVVRRIIGVVFAVCCVALVAYVCFEWYRMGCGYWSLAAAIAFYGSMMFGIWFAIDQTLQGK